MSTLLNGDLLSHLPLLVSLHYLGKHKPRNLVFSVMLYTENTDFAHSSTNFNNFWQKIATNSKACTIISLFNLSCAFGITSLIGCEIDKAEMTHFQRHCLLVSMTTNYVSYRTCSLDRSQSISGSSGLIFTIFAP